MRDPNLTTAIADMPAIPRIGSGDLLGIAVNFSKTNNKTKIWN